MSTRQTLRSLSVALVLLSFPAPSPAQIPFRGREHAELTRTRPADVHLANQTIMVQVKPIDARAAGMTERVKKLITNRMVGVSKNLREVSKDPYFLVDCSITRYDYNERTEKKKLLLVKEQGTFKIITATLEASYNVTRVSGNVPLFGGNTVVPYKAEFQEGVQTAPVKDEIENALIRTLVDRVLQKLINTEEKLKVRLMGEGDLDRYARLAQAGQWTDYIESLKALPEKKPDKNGKSEFEGDRYYDLSIAYEARFYEMMWKDYKLAQQYLDFADSALRKAQQFDPREKEYINALARLGQGKEYFEAIQKRFPKNFEDDKSAGSKGDRGVTADPGKQLPPPPPGAMTNKDVVKLVNAGASERLIIAQINEAKALQFDTSANGIADLLSAGVSETIIDAMKRAMRQQSPGRRPR